MVARAREIAFGLSETDQIAVINAHPRIGERPDRVRASRAVVSRSRATTTTTRHLRCCCDWRTSTRSNEQKFGFRFVVFVNRRPKAALVPVFEARLRGSRDEERQTALREILAIAADRLKD